MTGYNRMRLIPLFFSVLLACKLALAAYPETAGIYLVDQQKNETRIGEVVFIPTDNKQTSVKVSIDKDQFTEHFLSMRPFRCIEGSSEWFCYLEYPYDLRSSITCLLYTSPSPRDATLSRMPSSA